MIRELKDSQDLIADRNAPKQLWPTLATSVAIKIAIQYFVSGVECRTGRTTIGKAADRLIFNQSI
jgi:hypothetical protein